MLANRGERMSRFIGFACTTIFHYIHFSRIAKNFGDQAIFIIATPKYTNDRFDRLVVYLQKHNVKYCTTNDVITGTIELKAIVGAHFLPFFSFIDSSVPRIRVLYGYAKDAWNYGDWNKGFDLILAYGPYSQR